MNVVPRTGFERNHQAEFVLSAGNFYQTNDQFSFDSQSERFAYYASVNGNRSNLGSPPADSTGIIPAKSTSNSATAFTTKKY